MIILFSTQSFFLLLRISFILNAIFAAKAGGLTPCFVGDVNPGPAGDGPGTVGAPSSSFKESTGELNILMEDTTIETSVNQQRVEDTSISGGDPSINQPRNPRDSCLGDIRAEMLRQFQVDVGNRNFFMKLAFFCYRAYDEEKLQFFVDNIFHELELNDFTLEELQQFLLDIKRDKKVLVYFFQRYWP
jgi:hypothetical protein